MEIFWRLFLSHLIADFTLQTNWINRIKRERLIGIFIHVFVHLTVTIFLLFPYLENVWFNTFGVYIKGYIVILILCFLHFTVDHLRVFIIKKGIYPDNTLSFLLDQIFHIYFIFMFSPINDLQFGFLGKRIVMILSFLVIVTHTTTVLIYYVEKDMDNASFPSFDEKYLMIFERAVLFSFFLLDVRWWYILVVLWIFQMVYMKKKRFFDVTYKNLLLSILISLMSGFIVRYLH